MRGKAFHLGDARFTLGLVMGVLAGVLPLFCPGTGSGQAITPTTGAGNLGTTVTQNGNIYSITGGTRPEGGTNLFHSFGEFGVPTNNIANFLNETALPTSNILGRVTGGNISNIFGAIETTGFGNANLFLMNPAGFLFGPNATVNVGGMVAFTSADYLKLTDNARFNAMPNASADALLTALPVAAFGFLGSDPGAITVQGGQFSVADGQSISLIGGNISIESGTPEGGTAQPAQLSAPNGTIHLASAASPGEFEAATLQPLPNVDGAPFTSFGSVTLAAGSTIDVGGTSAVSIRGGAFILSVDNAVLTTAATATLANSIILSNGSMIAAETGGASPSGDITLNANTVQLNDGSTIATRSQGSGAAGNINLTVSESLTLQGVDPFGNPSRILSDTTSSGNSGAIDVQAPSGSVMLNGGLIKTLTTSDGLAGNINLNVRNLTVRAGGQIATSGSDAAPSGSITVDASDTISFSGRIDPLNTSSSSGIFNVNSGFNGTGDISIQTGNLLMADGARIRNDATFDLSSAETPKISIAASNAVALSGESGIIVDTLFSDVGSLAISAHSISLSDVSVISTRTVGPGAGGQLTLNANNISLTGGSQVVSSTEQDAGRGGDVTIVATDRLSMSGQGVDQMGSTVSSGIFTFSSPFATGDAGNVSVSASTVEISGGAQINSTTFGSGRGGSVAVQGLASPADSTVINGSGSGIFTDAQGTGAGGNIFVNANSVTLQNGGTLSAKTSGTETTATGGSITTNATNQLTMTGGASITASSTGPGNTGNIQINAGNQFAMTNSTVTTEADAASGGTIKITTTPSGTVELSNSTISASVLDGAGGGGSVNIDPQFVILQNSQILAQAKQGPGGNISITTNLLLPDANSVISASSEFGVNGTVTIQSPNAPGSGQVQPLGKTPLQATSLLNQHCASLAGGEFSSFTVAGRDSLPTEPGSWLASPLALGPAGFSAGTLTVGGEQTRVVDPADETTLLSLRQIAPAGFLTQTFAVDWSAGCRS